MLQKNQLKNNSQIENLARMIDEGFQEGYYNTWVKAWDYHKSTIGTISIQLSMPTGQVVAEILDAIEAMEN